jgi:hypothetical protein
MADGEQGKPRPALKLSGKSGEVVPGRPRLRLPPDENPSADDIEKFGDVTRICPECKKEVFDDAAVCYHCGHAFERTTAGFSRSPKWIIVTILVLIAAFVITTLWGAF